MPRPRLHQCTGSSPQTRPRLRAGHARRRRRVARALHPRKESRLPAQVPRSARSAATRPPLPLRQHTQPAKLPLSGLLSTMGAMPRCACALASLLFPLSVWVYSAMLRCTCVLATVCVFVCMCSAQCESATRSACIYALRIDPSTADFHSHGWHAHVCTTFVCHLRTHRPLLCPICLRMCYPFVLSALLSAL